MTGSGFSTRVFYFILFSEIQIYSQIDCITCMISSQTIHFASNRVAFPFNLALSLLIFSWATCFSCIDLLFLSFAKFRCLFLIFNCSFASTRVPYVFSNFTSDNLRSYNVLDICFTRSWVSMTFEVEVTHTWIFLDSSLNLLL